MTDWAGILHRIAPNGKIAIVDGLAASFPVAITKFGLTTPLRQAHFLAQAAFESAGLTTTVEEASGAAYQGRVDLGNVHPGDGVRYKGRGLFQLTGRANYANMSKVLAIDFISHPELVATFPYALTVSLIFWRSHGLNVFADHDDVRGVTRRINGGLNGLADRMEYLARAKRALKGA
jgi:putative chitinase